ncbi:MAG: hypothetical protein DRO23_03040 [Thermoprotei archaeon]|nr:MAG: hypothetical protein DRO23_03040 [Thermoprotei archaeon]
MENASELKLSYFNLQAYWGGTKHLGGLKATRELIELCGIGEGMWVLEVSCGVGATTCYLAKKCKCKVVSIDVLKKMVDWAVRRVKREKVQNKVEFVIADAQNLPFRGNVFDSVICESVNAFIEDKQKAVNEYVRVVKAGGSVGFNESTWIKTPPPIELIEYLTHTTGVKEILPSDGWKELLKNSGLTNIVVKTHRMKALSLIVNEIRWLGLRDYLRGWYRFLFLIIHSPAFRKYIREMKPPKNATKNYFKYLGYGIYVSKKR